MENNIHYERPKNIEIKHETSDKSKYISLSVSIIFIIILAVFFLYIIFIKGAMEQQEQSVSQQAKNVLPEQELMNCLKITKTDSSEKALFSLGLAYINNKMYRESILVYKKIILKNPNNASALNNIGFAYGCMNDWDNGIKNCLFALQLDSNFQLAKNNIKWFLSEKVKTNKK